MIDQLNLKQFNTIYDKTYNKVVKIVVCRCSNMDDVNDIVQEVYLEVYNAIVKKKNIDDFEKYVIGIAKNKVKKHYSLLYRINTIPLFSSKNDDKELVNVLKSDEDILKIVLKEQDIEDIWKYLKSKRIIIQKIFYLYYELDLTIKEISKELDVGESYIKNCLYRTLKELQEFLKGDCD